MSLDDDLENALNEALARRGIQVDFPLPSESEPAFATRRPEPYPDSLPFRPELPLPKLMSRLSPAARSLLQAAQQSQLELGEAILTLLPDDLRQDWEDGWDRWRWPPGSKLAKRKPANLSWLLNVAQWLSSFSMQYGGSEIEPQTLAAAVLMTRGLGPGSSVAGELSTWADRLDERQVKLFESLLRYDPDEPFLRACLYCFYQEQHEHWQDILWHIKHCPESPILGDLCTHSRCLPPWLCSRLLSAWAGQIRRHPENIHVLSNAANQLKGCDHKLALMLYQRCWNLDPTNPDWPMALARLVGERSQRHEALRYIQAAYELEKNESMRRQIRLDWLKISFLNGQAEQAERMAWELLRTSSPTVDHGLEIHECNLVLGHLALERKDLEDARIHLLAAARVAGYPTLNSFGPSMCLVYRLLRFGQREVVLNYFELCAKFWDDPELQDWADAVRRGLVPEFGPNLFYSGLLPRE